MNRAGFLFRAFATPSSLALSLAGVVAERLARAMAEKGCASLAVSGGQTPKAFLHALSVIDIDWRGVSVTLADDRCVDEPDLRSNARLVRETLLCNRAAAARYHPLVCGGGPCPEAPPILASPLDVLVLGMGLDGHTASLFPGGHRLAAALDAHAPDPVFSMMAPAAPEPRVTLGLRPLLAARWCALHIEGRQKSEVLGTALSPGDAADMPIRAVLRGRSADVTEIFWSA